MTGGKERLDAYHTLRSEFNATEGDGEYIDINVNYHQADWLRTSRKVGIDPSALAGHGLWLAGLSRLAHRHGLQSVLASQGDRVAVELPGWQELPDEEVAGFRFGIPARSGAILGWMDDNYPHLYPEDILFNGVRILALSAQLKVPKLVTCTRVDETDSLPSGAYSVEEPIFWHRETSQMPPLA